MNTGRSFATLFSEYLNMSSLPEKEYIECSLISKYEDKVSKRLQERKKELLKKGKEIYQKNMRELIVRDNYLLKAMPKDDIWQSRTILIPLIYNKEEGEN